MPLRSQGYCAVGRGLSGLHWVRCNGRGPHLEWRQETHVSSPDFPWARSDSDRSFAAEFEQESQASSCVEEWPDGEGGGSISTQINTLREQLNAAILANSDAIKAEESRAKGIESGLRTDVDKITEDLVSLTATVTENETDIEKKVSDLTSEVNSNSNALGAISLTVGEHTSQISTLSSDVDTLIDDVDAVETAISTLIGADTDKSVRAIAAEELAMQLIPEEAQESLDTLAEIAAWIQDHPNDVSEINLAIQNLEATNFHGVAKSRTRLSY